MLGQNDKRIFLNITEGKIIKRNNQKVELYDYLEGDLERIFLKDRVFRGETVPYWYVDIRDNETGLLYSLGLGATSGVWRALILSLASIKEYTHPVRIVPYRKGDYDKVMVLYDGERMDWISELPPVEFIEVQGQRIKSTAKRDEYITRLVDEVNQRLEDRFKVPEVSSTARPRRQVKGITLSSFME